MTPTAVACAAGGLLLIGLALHDIVATVLHPRVESPLSNHFHRRAWQLLRLLTRPFPDARRQHALLGWGLPLLVAGLIAVWIALLLSGFALLYYPWLADRAYFDAPDGSAGTLLEALYFSGASLTTVGYGDFQAVHGLFRALAILEAASGFVVISLSVAYLLAVYPTLSRTHAIAVALDAEVAGQPGALPLVRRYLRNEGGWEAELGDRLRELGLALLELTEVHETHPVLYYAHPPQVHHSFLRVLVTAQSLVGLLRYGLSPDRHGRLVRNPQLLLLEQSLGYSLRRLTASLHIPAVDGDDSPAQRCRWAATYDQLCDELEALGLVSARTLATAPVAAVAGASADDPARDGSRHAGPARWNGAVTGAERDDNGDPAFDRTSRTPLDAYLAFRLETDPHVAAYAAACGYDINESRRDREVAWC